MNADSWSVKIVFETTNETIAVAKGLAISSVSFVQIGTENMLLR